MPDTLACQGSLLRASFLGSLSVGLILLIGLGYILLAAVQANWDWFFLNALDAAFKRCDTDGSGRITKNELYLAVLELTFLLPVSICAPTRKYTMEIMDLMDLDADGHLNKQQFALAMKYLSSNILIRMFAVVVIYAAAPLLASLVHALFALLDWSGLPQWARCLGSLANDAHLWAPIIAMALIYVLKPPANAAIDWYYERRAQQVVDLVNSGLWGADYYCRPTCCLPRRPLLQGAEQHTRLHDERSA
jgi:hypothetical protein